MHFRNTIVAVLGFAAFVACSDRAGVTGPTNGAGARGPSTGGADLASTASIGVTLASSSIAIGKTTQATAIVKDSAGNTISKTLTWKSSNTAVATVSSTGLVTGVAAGSASIIASTYSKSGSATVTVTSTTKPGTVTDLSATAASASSVTLSFTQVHNGAGAPANYDIRFSKPPLSWGSAPSVTSGTCAIPVVGTAIGAKLTCTVSGLAASTAYNFQVIAFRGTMNLNATYGALSNIAAATTPASGSTTPPTPVATTVSVSPATASLAVGASQTLAATVKDQSGAAMSCSALTWASQNTAIVTVSASGSAKAIAAGSANITATCASASGAAAITVTSSTTPPPPTTPVVTTVSVSPSSASIIAGATQTLTATVRDQNGATMSGQTVTWSSSSASFATVSASGIVTGVAAGSAKITATSGTKSGSAMLTVTTPPTTPPTPPSAWNAHEPSGMNLLTERSFNAMGESGWYDENNSRYTIVQDPAAPRSASGVAQMKYPAGFSGGASPATAEKGLGSKYSTLYVSYWIKYSSNWQAHGSGANKQFCLWSNGRNDTITEGFGSGSGMIQPGVALQGSENAALRPNIVTNAELKRGVWHHLEYVIAIGTGTMDWWLDGVQVAHYTGRTITGPVWNTISWCPVWGGMGGTVPADQTMSMDHLYVSGK
jgi:uncharacterized protein YjdB